MPPLNEHEWLAEYREVLELIAERLVATGHWPDPVILEREQRANGAAVSVIEAVGRMPSYVGGRSYQPPEVRLSLAALGSSNAGRPIAQAIYTLLELARRRFADPTAPARLGIGDLSSAGIETALRAAVSRMVADGSVPFLGGGSSGVDYWDLAIDERLVTLDGCTDAESLIALLKVKYWSAPEPTPAAPDPARGATPHPTALVSYAQSSPWQQEVLAFTMALRTFGIDAEMDLFHTADHREWPIFGSELIQNSDFTLVAVDAAYRRRWEGSEAVGVGAGAAREAAALKAILERDRQEFVRRVKVVVLPGASREDIPDELAGMLERFEISAYEPEALEGLLRSLTGQPAYPKTPLGELPVLPPKAVADLRGAEPPRRNDGTAVAATPRRKAPAEIDASSRSTLRQRLSQVDQALASFAGEHSDRQIELAAEKETLEASLRRSEPATRATTPDLEAVDPETKRRNVVEARALVEEAVVATPVLLQAQAGLRGVHNTAHQEREAVSNAMSSYVNARQRLITFDTRLILHLGFEHPVRLALARLIQVVDAAGNEVIELITFDQAPPEDKFPRAMAERQRMQAARDRLLVAASDWMRGEARNPSP